MVSLADYQLTNASFGFENSSQRHWLQKLELHQGSRINHYRAGGMPILRLARCFRRASRLERIRLHRDLRPFTKRTSSSTVSGSYLRELARDDATFPNTLLPAFNTNVSFDRDILRELRLEASAYDGL